MINKCENEKKTGKELYFQTSAAAYLQSFINEIADNVNTPCISTGFNNLDNALDGGFYEGLYFIGAVSSLGKTTFITQIGDQIAKSGEDVLIFSLEMSKFELMAKSISRNTFINVQKNKDKLQNAKTARGITVGKRYQYYDKEEKRLICNSIKDYKKYAENIYITEGVGSIGAEQIRKKIKKHINITGRKPVVIVDYLQILAPHNERATDKQNIDKAILELKRISRDHKIAIIAISSLNRVNYHNSVSMESFKESGTIEYSCDVLIGLQMEGVSEKSNFGITEAAKRKNPRDVELVILKNRNGEVGNKIGYSYYPLFNFFAEKQ